MDKSDPDYAEFEAAKQKVRELQDFLKKHFEGGDTCDGSQPYCPACQAKRLTNELELMWNLIDV